MKRKVFGLLVAASALTGMISVLSVARAEQVAAQTPFL